MAKYYIGIDQGTTNTTAVLVDENWQIQAKSSIAHKQIYPRPGWVEHDPFEIYGNIKIVVQEIINMVPGVNASDIKGLGLDHQGETCVIWDKKTGEPIYNAIVWQDRRTSDIAEKLKIENGERIKEICGLLPDAYHSATKLMWMLDNCEGARERAERGELLAGTMNTWIFWMLTGGDSFETDISSAGSMMLMDIETTDWSDEIIDMCGIPKHMLPRICDTNHIYGNTIPEEFLGISVPIAGGIADSPSGIIGGGCVGEGVLKCSYGTGSFMHYQTGTKKIISDSGLFTRTCWRLDGQPYYLLSGAAYIAGGAVTWLKDGLKLIEDVRETETLSLKVRDTNGVYFVPAFSGLATPFWDMYARGLLIGLTSGTEKEHVVRAVMEALAYQVANCFNLMQNESGTVSSCMRADGGMVENKFLMQFQADMIGVPVEVPEEKETCAFGAACLAGYSLGDLKSLEEVRNIAKVKYAYEPQMSQDERETRLRNWLRAVERSRAWEERSF
ncbi:MAG: glycerol kinase GlpK [Lachnospiraceae bacterium]|nr:glycerol kinase GlpK [Lachnospiraceae bacterium]